jgi:crossover junction endodeoxyribonuclease RuvC
VAIYIGIDPGLKGAIAVINDRVITFHDMPVVQVKVGTNLKNQMDAHACALLLRRYLPPPTSSTDVLVTIEKVAPMPSFKVQRKGEEPSEQPMGVTSAFTFGRDFGILIGLCAGIGVPFQLIHPVTWKKRMMADMGKDKDASRVKAMQLYPQMASQLSRKKDHARGDALLLATYARQMAGVPQEVPVEPYGNLFAR